MSETENKMSFLKTIKHILINNFQNRHFLKKCLEVYYWSFIFSESS